VGGHCAGNRPVSTDRNAFDVVVAEIPQYRCHKEVRALQIDRVVWPDGGPQAIIHFIDNRFAPVPAEPRMFVRYKPLHGDYWVLYSDGYKSISPKAEFEAGYTRIP
jgi:hypothetical protein